MTRATLERRVKSLEVQVAQLQGELRSACDGKTKDWRRTVGVFTDDEDMKKILQESMHIREMDRKKVRSKTTAKRSTKR